MNVSSTSFSVKNLVIGVAALYAIGLSVFLMYNTLKIAAPINQYGNIATMSNVPETGIKTYCESNSDCWCRNFDGAHFGKGKVESVCDLSKGKCQQCLYR